MRGGTIIGDRFQQYLEMGSVRGEALNRCHFLD
jgi:hypothetical protein